MARFSQHVAHHSGTVALVSAILISILPGAAQIATDPPHPILLDRKVASKLLLTQVKPEYPAVARMNYIQGRVRVEVVVTREGHVGDVHVVQGHPLLAASALKAVRSWLYRPFRAGSGPAEFETFVDMNFTLRNRTPNQIPRQAEEDLSRQVRPPEILRQQARKAPGASVRMRVLVSEEGQVIDSEFISGSRNSFDAARKSVGTWTFRPARWGTLPVPWCLDVDVPVVSGTAQGGSDPGHS